MTTRTHYDELGVGPDADPTELRRAYLALAQRHHPDRTGGDDARMQRINEAWATLGNPARRRQYDLVHLRRADPAPTWTAGPQGPTHPFAHERADLEDLDDDQPVRITVVLPKWLAMLPTGLFVASVLLGFVGLLFGPAVLFLAMLCFVSSILLFLASPFVALYASRRGANR